jgi:LPS-assembly lipoprotein
MKSRIWQVGAGTTGWMGSVRVWLLPLSVLLLTACGFHLRTWELEGNVQTAKITSNLRNPVADPLGRALESAGVEVVGTGSADITIELISDRSGRRAVSVTDQARAAEYQTTLTVVYALHDANGNSLAEPRSIQASRIFTVDRDNIVGSSEEQALLQREMVDDLVQQIIRGVNAVVTAPASGTATTSGGGAA